MNEIQGASNMSPEPRKLVPGDQVKLKGVDGPVMVVNRMVGDGILSCVRWDKDSSKFRFAAIHRDALAYFGERGPGDITLPDGAIGIVRGVGDVFVDAMVPVGTLLYPAGGYGRSRF